MEVATAFDSRCPRKTQMAPCFTVVLLLLSAATAFPEIPSQAPAPNTIAVLRLQIEKVLKDTGTPGAGIALVGRGGPIWAAGIGLADTAQNRPATEDTLFPIGSISKSFVALSVLKLQQEGRLNLQDTLRSRAPDVEFDNPWEATNPIRIVDLLEHTTGWDDSTPHEGEWDPVPETTRHDGMAFYPPSRTSRWRPGTSFSYSNLGPGVAAYVVERISGEKFEDYVARTWFGPLGMTGAFYLGNPGAPFPMATLYGAGGGAVHPHFNVLTRPSGGIVASPRDMANYVEFYLNRGTYRGTRFLKTEAIDRMERPTSTYAAAEGVETGYGLGNYSTDWGNWIFHGHGGAVPGALAEMHYLPREGIGYAVMINCENGYAMYRLEEVVRTYLVRNLKPPPTAPFGSVDETQMAKYSGWYGPITPRNERFRYLEGILGVTHVTLGNGHLYLSDLTNGKYAYARVDGRVYRRLDNSRSLVLVGDHTDGTLFQTVGGPTFRRMPTYIAYLKLGFALVTVLLMSGTVIFAFVWIPRRLFGKLEGSPWFGVRGDPLLATLSGTAVGILIWEASGNYYARADGAIWSGDWVSIADYAAYGTFAFYAIRGLLRALRRRRDPIGRMIWWHSFATSLALSAWAVYLCYWGLRSDLT
jgi:CubicO group peptidase (beta-lactamase class C family)